MRTFHLLFALLVLGLVAIVPGRSFAGCGGQAIVQQAVVAQPVIAQPVYAQAVIAQPVVASYVAAPVQFQPIVAQANVAYSTAVAPIQAVAAPRFQKITTTSRSSRLPFLGNRLSTTQRIITR